MSRAPCAISRTITNQMSDFSHYFPASTIDDRLRLRGYSHKFLTLWYWGSASVTKNLSLLVADRGLTRFRHSPAPACAAQPCRQY